MAAAPAGGGKITRDLVLATELEIIDRDGAEALSMRRRAGPGPDDPLPARPEQGSPARRRRRDRPRPAQGRVRRPGWTAQLRALARDYRRLAHAHPHVVPYWSPGRGATPPGLRLRGTLRPLEDVLALLTRTGFSGPDALHIYRALFGFLHGHVLNELQELAGNPDETEAGSACNGAFVLTGSH